MREAAWKEPHLPILLPVLQTATVVTSVGEYQTSKPWQYLFDEW